MRVLGNAGAACNIGLTGGLSVMCARDWIQHGELVTRGVGLGLGMSIFMSLMFALSFFGAMRAALSEALQERA